MGNRKIQLSVGLFVIISIIIFIYFTLQIGALRLQSKKSTPYIVCLSDAFGLHKKDDIKIAGVKVGSINDIQLSSQDCVRLFIEISSDFLLRDDAYALVRQEGMLGGKYLEIVPGTPTRAPLSPGSELVRKGPHSVSIDTLFEQMHTIANHVTEVTSTLKDAVANVQSNQTVNQTLAQVNDIVANLATVTKSVTELVNKNQGPVNTAVEDATSLVRTLKEEIPQIVSTLKELSSKMCNTVAPTIEKTINQVAQKVEETTQTINRITNKIDSGQGTLGKLINDEQAYKNLNVTVECLNKTASALENLRFGIDTNIQAMTGTTQYSDIRDAKGYFDFYIWPTEHYFMLAGLVGSRLGRVTHKDIFSTDKTPVSCTTKDCLPLHNQHLVIQETERWQFDLQFGTSWFNDSLRVRAGLFQSTLGAGVDWKLPFSSEHFRWWTSFEAYDFKGHLRIRDDRPHLKWTNRVFFNDYIYVTFGLDDIASPKNRNFFAGAGLCLGHAY